MDEYHDPLEGEEALQFFLHQAGGGERAEGG